MSSFQMERQRGTSFDPMLLASIILLAGCGMAMLFSASYTDAIETRHAANYFLARQMQMFVLGSLCAMVIAFIPLDFFKNWAKLIWFGVLIINCCTRLFPEINGACRWIILHGVSIQPSEFFKISIILYLASDFVRIEDGRGQRTCFHSLFVMGLSLMVVLGWQSDLSTTIFLFGLGLAMFICSKVSIKTIILVILICVLFGAVAILLEPYRLERVLSHYSGNVDTSGSGYQITRALQALQAGGFWGRGIGSGSFKMGSLPEAKSDFIFAIVGEELGFIGVGIIILLFAFFGFKGYQVASAAKDRFSYYVAFGVTTSILYQMLMNIAVVADVIPTTGITMPFFSQGGTSMLTTMIMCGFLLNVSRNSGQGDNYEQY